MTRLAAAGLFALLLGACATPQASPPRFGPDDLDGFFDSMVDRHLEAGYEDPVIAADDPFMAERLVVITASMNERTAKDAVARLLLLNAQDPKAPIDLVLSTQGGWLDPTFAIIDTIQLIQAPVNVWGVGGVYSAGALILASATGSRTISEYAIVMVHANLSDPKDDRPAALRLRRFQNLWRTYAKLPEGWYPMTGENTYYLSPEEAVEYGIADAIAEPSMLPRR